MNSALQDISYETLAQVENLIRENRASGADIIRDITTATGLTYYDLQAPAKMTVPVITPLLNLTPRRPGTGDTATHWKRVTGLNTANVTMGVPEGKRQGTVTTAVTSASATYASLGLEDNVSWEADLAAQSFEDVRAMTALRLLYATKIGEETVLLGGNASGIALGTATAPTLTGSATGGTLAANTWHVSVVALTLEAYLAAAVNATGVAATTAITSPVGETFTVNRGAGQVSAETTVTTSGTTSSIAATTPAVSGAVAYAWYVGTSSTRRINQITTINSASITAASGGSNQTDAALSADYSKNQYEFDGLLSNAFQFGTVTTMATGTAGTGTPLTSDGAGGIVEITSLMKTLWDTTRVSPRYLVMNSQEFLNIYKKVVGGGAAPLFRFNIDASNGMSEVQAGRVLGTFINPFTPNGGMAIKIILHPTIPAGTILALADMVPGQYIPSSNLGQLWEMHTQREYHQIEWPPRTRAYETGVYVREVLAHYYPATLGLLTNIGNG